MPFYLVIININIIILEMGKRRGTTGSRHIKTRHKKISQTRRLLTPSVNAGIRNINKVITDQINKNPKPAP